MSPPHHPHPGDWLPSPRMLAVGRDRPLASPRPHPCADGRAHHWIRSRVFDARRTGPRAHPPCVRLAAVVEHTRTRSRACHAQVRALRPPTLPTVRRPSPPIRTGERQHRLLPDSHFALAAVHSNDTPRDDSDSQVPHPYTPTHLHSYTPTLLHSYDPRYRPGPLSHHQRVLPSAFVPHEGSIRTSRAHGPRRCAGLATLPQRDARARQRSGRCRRRCRRCRTGSGGGHGSTRSRGCTATGDRWQRCRQWQRWR